jgi:hypothetical protein
VTPRRRFLPTAGCWLFFDLPLLISLTSLSFLSKDLRQRRAAIRSGSPSTRFRCRVSPGPPTAKRLSSARFGAGLMLCGGSRLPAKRHLSLSEWVYMATIRAFHSRVICWPSGIALRFQYLAVRWPIDSHRADTSGALDRLDSARFFAAILSGWQEDRLRFAAFGRKRNLAGRQRRSQPGPTDEVRAGAERHAAIVPRQPLDCLGQPGRMASPRSM